MKLPTTARDLIAILEVDGWYRARVRGSHYYYKHPEKRGMVCVPANRRSRALSPSFALSTLKRAGLR